MHEKIYLEFLYNIYLVEDDNINFSYACSHVYQSSI